MYGKKKNGNTIYFIVKISDENSAERTKLNKSILLDSIFFIFKTNSFLNSIEGIERKL